MIHSFKTEAVAVEFRILRPPFGSNGANLWVKRMAKDLIVAAGNDQAWIA